MPTETRNNHEFPTPFRALFGIVAIATLLSSAPWAQSNSLAAATGYAGAMMFCAMAAFGNKTAWQRHLTMAIAVVYLVLIVCKITGLAA